MAHSKQQPQLPGIGTLIRAGFTVPRRYTGLLLSLYCIQLAIVAGAGCVMTRVLSGAFGAYPEFDRAIDDRDVAALLTAISQQSHVVSSVFWLAMGTLLLYAVVSWVLTGGLVTTLMERPYSRQDVATSFGRGAASTLIPYFKLALCSLTTYLPAAVVLGFGIGFGFRDLSSELSFVAALGRILLSVSPGLIMFLFISTSVDYARIALAANPETSAMRALFRAHRLVLTRGTALAHAGCYYAFFIAMGTTYVVITFDRPMLGATGAISLLILRQAVSIIRFTAKLVLIGGQVEFLDAVDTAAHRRR